MSLDLDERQRAMLLEMGLRVFDAGPMGRIDGTPPDPPRQAGGEADRESAGPAVGSLPARPLAPVVAPSVPTVMAAAVTPVAPPVARGEHPSGLDQMDWAALQDAVAGCRACRLCEGRRNTVFGVGAQQADWLVVGEAPGEQEDLQGEPFVGQAGKLLDNMLAALALRRGQQVYIANVLKCRPPGNRNPEPDEVAQCEPFLRRQVELLQPKIILAMGRFALQTLLQTTEPVGKLRGRVHQYNGVPLVVTYHPAYLLRNLPDKAKAWADLCLAQSVYRAAVAAP